MSSKYLNLNRNSRYKIRQAVIKNVTNNSDESHETKIQPIPMDTSSVLGDMAGSLPHHEWDILSISSCDEDLHLELSSSDSDEENYMSETAPQNLPAQTIYPGCNLTLQESTALVLGVQSKHHLTNSATSDVLKLIELHLPTDSKLPTSIYKFKKSVNLNMWSTFVYYCQKCQHELNQEFNCSKCCSTYDKTYLRNSGHFFVVFQIQKQIEDLLKDDFIKQSLLRTFECRMKKKQSSYSDITDGEMYQKLPLNYRDLTCTFNSDGIPVFKSSKYSAWPLLLTINELPYNLRKKSVLIGGLWLGPKKPNFDLFLNKPVKEMNALSDIGIQWSLTTGLVVTSKVFFVVCIADSPARCCLQGTRQYNGRGGCSWCSHLGKSVKKGKGHCRSYYCNTDYLLRSEPEFRNMAKINDTSIGVVRESILLQLNNFNIITGFAVDIMHSVYLGIVRTFTNLWLTTTKQPYYIGNKIFLIDKIFLSCKLPSEITRICRSLTSRKFWKASEWRTWLLVSPFVLKHILKKTYLKHWELLAKSIFDLTKPEIFHEDLIAAEKNLSTFITGVQKLYSEEHMSFNVHQLNHLVACVKNWGPPWGTSAFCFESYNGKILKYVKSANGVGHQIQRGILIDQQFQNMAKLIFQENSAGFNFIIDCLCTFPENKSSCEIFKPKSCSNSEWLELIQSKCGTANILATSEQGRIKYSIFSTRNNSQLRSNNIIRIDNKSFGKIVQFVIVECQCQKGTCFNDLVVVVDVFTTKMYKSIPYISHISSLNSNNFNVLNISTLDPVKVIVIPNNGKYYLVEVPNLFEIE